MRKDASQIIYDEVSLLGHPALLTGWQVDQTTIPDGFHRYELRHADEDGGRSLSTGKENSSQFLRQHPDLAPLPAPCTQLSMGDNSCATLGAFLQKYSQKEV